jgi:hydroxymethylbilane synthase
MHRPDLKIIPIRGNIQTRLDKAQENNLDGIILATAGLNRLGLEGIITEIFEIDFLIPPPCQGTIVIQSREEDHETAELLEKITCPNTKLESLVERHANHTLGGNCHSPVGCYATIDVENNSINLTIGAFESKLNQSLVMKQNFLIDDKLFIHVYDFARIFLDNGGKKILKL